MLQINETVAISDSELSFSFVRASGPGGQNVNKVATAVQLRFDLGNCSTLSEEVKVRLRRLAGKRLTADGVLIITARRYRTQERNRQDALQRLEELIRRALIAPKPRLKKRPSKTAQQRRLQEKKHLSLKKQQRRSVSDPEE